MSGATNCGGFELKLLRRTNESEEFGVVRYLASYENGHDAHERKSNERTAKHQVSEICLYHLATLLILVFLSRRLPLL